MKNQKLIIMGVVALLVILGLGGLVMSKSNKTSVTMNSENGQTTVVTTEDSKMSIADLMGKGGNVKCSYQASGTDSGSMSALVYLSGKKMRVESSGTNPDGEAYESKMVSDGEFVYVWSDKEKTGMKIATDASTGSTDAWKGQASYINPEQKVDYKCDSWNVDEAVFTLPTDVKFTDLSAMQKTQCSACDSLSGEQKASCKEAMGCE